MKPASIAAHTFGSIRGRQRAGGLRPARAHRGRSAPRT
jgi:hypothetical protein